VRRFGWSQCFLFPSRHICISDWSPAAKEFAGSSLSPSSVSRAGASGGCREPDSEGWRSADPARVFKIRNCSGRSVGQTSGLPVSRASGPVFRRPDGHGVRDSVNRQTGGLPHTLLLSFLVSFTPLIIKVAEPITINHLPLLNISKYIRPLLLSRNTGKPVSAAHFSYSHPLRHREHLRGVFSLSRYVLPSSSTYLQRRRWAQLR